MGGVGLGKAGKENVKDAKDGKEIERAEVVI